MVVLVLAVAMYWLMCFRDVAFRIGSNSGRFQMLG